MSIRVKAALVLALAAAAATAASSAVFLALQARSARAAQEERVSLLLDNVRAMALEAQLGRDPLMLLDALAAMRRTRPEILRARARFGGRWEGPEPEPLPVGEGLRSERVDLPEGAGPGVLVEVVLSRRALDERLAADRESLTRNLAAAAVLVLAAGVLLSFPLSRTLTARLVAMEAAMKEIGEGRPAPELRTDGDDEVASLARGLTAMSARLRELDQMKRTFVSSVTHELRSPLFAIESYVKELLREAKALEPEDRRRLERIQANASRLAHFVTSLLDMARIERGALEFRPRDADLAALVEDAVEFHRARAEERGLTLALESEPGLPSLRADPDLVTQVIGNLLANAINHTRRGGRIDVAVRRRGAALECAVSDTGIGLAPEALARLFTPFERGPDPLRAGGAGLGLSISKAAVESHGGSIGASSEPGRGSRFWFSLPLAANKSLTANEGS